MDIVKIIFIILSFCYIFYCFYKGMKNVKYLEKVCTETIDATFEILKTKHFFWYKYYIINLTYEYKNKEYTSRKGLFKTVSGNKIPIFINPEKPEECEILRIKDRCSCKKYEPYKD